MENPEMPAAALPDAVFEGEWVGGEGGANPQVL